MSLRIYHNPRCKKSRAGLEYLISKTSDYEKVDYLQNGLSTDEIKEMVLKLHIPPKELVRTNEDIYKKELKSRNFNDNEWIQILSENPKLLKRPVIVGKHKAVIGDPVNNIDKLLTPNSKLQTPNSKLQTPNFNNMRQITSYFLSLIVLAIFLFTGGCKKDEGLTHISDFEKKIHTTVNNYRATKSLPAITLQYLMVNDAQIHSKKMANGLVPYSINPGDEVMINLNTLKTNLGGDGLGAVVQFSESENADTIVNRMVRDASKRVVLEGNFNQTGVGSAKDATGKWYVTQTFIHVSKK